MIIGDKSYLLGLKHNLKLISTFQTTPESCTTINVDICGSAYFHDSFRFACIKCSRCCYICIFAKDTLSDF